jgi:hypothetical protein
VTFRTEEVGKNRFLTAIRGGGAMINADTVDLARQRMAETEQAIAEQRRYVESLSDPVLRTIAARTLATLEDMLLIMRRTQGLLAETSGAPCGVRGGGRGPEGACAHA